MVIDLLIKNCTIVTHNGVQSSDLGIAISNGKIMSIGRESCLPESKTVIDVGGKILVPGIIDCHVHTRSPGLEYKEDWETATKAAAAGGVTSIITMGTDNPPASNVEDFSLHQNLGVNNSLIDFQTIALLQNDDEAVIQQLDTAGCVGYKIFLSVGSSSDHSVSDGQIYEIMKSVSKTGKRLVIHAENNSIVEYYSNMHQQNGKDEPIYHARSRPVIAEVEAISRMITFAESTDCPIHIAHLGSGSGVEKVIDGKKSGIDITAETLPEYLWFTDEVLKSKGNIARMNPPFRNQTEQNKLWNLGINEKGIDCIATDHAPHTEEEKGVYHPFSNTWEVNSGFGGLETEVPAMLTLIHQGEISMEKWVYMHSTHPAQIWDMYPNKGSLQVGTDADFTIIDPDDQWTLDSDKLHSKSKVTPFDGEKFHGSVSKTFVRGELIYDGEEVLGEPGYGEVI